MQLVEGDAAALPMPDASFDAVTIGFGLLHLPRPHLALAEASRSPPPCVITCSRACSLMRQRLQPDASEPAARCVRGCGPIRQSLRRPHA